MDICNKFETKNKHKNTQKLTQQENRNRKICARYTKIINMMNKSMNRKE